MWHYSVEDKVVRSLTGSRTTYIGWVWNTGNRFEWKGSREFDTHREAIWFVASTLMRFGISDIKQAMRVSFRIGDTVKNIITGELVSFIQIKSMGTRGGANLLCVEGSDSKLHPIENII
jgi:hypothetical protein